jgi:hypothetical protein
MIDTYESTPIVNLISGDSFIYEKYSNQYFELCDKNRPPMQAHKNKLGKQSYC